MWMACAMLCLALVSRVIAVLVADGSPCNTMCGNVLQQTTPDDVVCDQGDYQTSDAGSVFEECIACELTSGYHNDTNTDVDTDVDALQYNLRFTFGYCLFGVPDNRKLIDSPCATTEGCEKFEDGVLFKNLSADVGSFEYCHDWPAGDYEHVKQCGDCLRAGGNEYLANFFTVLQAGCEQKPAPGVTLGIKGNIFSTENVTIVSPTPEVTVDPDWFDNGPLNVGAKAGIVAAGVVVILVIVGCCIVWRGKRRRRAFLRNYDPKAHKGWPSPLQTSSHMKEAGDTPLSQRPLRAWDDSPMSARSDYTFPRYFSPYSSQYNSPVSATEGAMAQWPVLAPPQQMQQQLEPNHSIGVALGGDGSAQENGSKGKEKVESYEMHHVDNGQHNQHDGDPYAPPSPEQRSYSMHSRTYSGSYRNFSGRRGSGM